MNVRLWSLMLAWSLGAWALVIVMSGGMAAVIFPTMKQLDPVLPEFVSTPGDHWSLAAGLVMRKVFFISDIAQLIFAMVAVVSLTIVLKASEIGIFARRLLSLSLAVSCIAMLTSAFWLSPALRRDMDAALIAGRAGNSIAMKASRTQFAEKHKFATTLMVTTLGGVVLASLTAAAALKPFAKAVA